MATEVYVDKTDLNNVVGRADMAERLANEMRVVKRTFEKDRVMPSVYYITLRPVSCCTMGRVTRHPVPEVLANFNADRGRRKLRTWGGGENTSPSIDFI